MHLGRKMTYALQHIHMIFQGDHDPIEARLEAAKQLRAKIDEELAAAEQRHAKNMETALADADLGD